MWFNQPGKKRIGDMETRVVIKLGRNTTEEFSSQNLDDCMIQASLNKWAGLFDWLFD